jgi:hypothetical protein
MIMRIAVALGRIVTAFGLSAGCGRATSIPMSSTRPASRCRANTAAPKPIISKARFSARPFFDGCAVNGTNAAWPQSLLEEDTKRESRERESFVSERTHVGNRMEARPRPLGIRGFKNLRTARRGLRAAYVVGEVESQADKRCGTENP